MAVPYQNKRSSVPGRVPTTSDIVVGELAINFADQVIYTNTGNSIVAVGLGNPGTVDHALTANTVVDAVQANITQVGTLTTLSSTGEVVIATANEHGGTGYAGILTATNTTAGATNPNKFLRLNTTGNLQVINSAYNATIMDLDDTGALKATSFTGDGSGLTGVVISGDQSVTTLATTQNGIGHNVALGDDTWIGDVNEPNTFRVTGQQDATEGGIIFGNANTERLYRSGTGPLTYTGNMSVGGTISGNGSGLTGVSVDLANVTGAGNIASVNLNGNSSEFLAGDGSFYAISTSSLANGTSNVVVAQDGPVTISSDGASNVLVINGATSQFNGPVGITGNLTVTGNLNYQNVQQLVVGDPLIFVGANNTSDLVELGFVGSYDNGTPLHTGFARDHTSGEWKLFDSLATEPSTTIDFANTTPANLSVGTIKGDGSLLTNITAGNVVGTVGTASTAYSVDSGNVVGLTAAIGSATAAVANVAYSVDSGNVVGLTAAIGSATAAAANVAYSVSAANVSGLTAVLANSSVAIANVAYSVDAGNVSGLTSVIANTLVANATYATSAGSATSATTAETVTANAQPNITSVGALTSLNVSGAVGLGSIGNVSILGGTPGQAITTDGSGGLSFASITIDLDQGTY